MILMKLKLRSINQFLEPLGFLFTVDVDHVCKTDDQDAQLNGVSFELIWKDLDRTQRRTRWNRIFGVEQ